MSKAQITQVLFCNSAQQEVVRHLANQLKDLQQELRTAHSNVQACKQAINRHDRTDKELKLRMQEMEDHAEALRDALDKENAEDGRLDALQSSLKEAEADKQLHEGSLNDSEASMNDIVDRLKTVRRKASAKDQEIQGLEENSRVAESERTVVASKRQGILGEKNAAVAQIERQKVDRDRLGQKKEQLVERVLEYIEKASLVSTRVLVDEGETTVSLDQKLHKLQNDLNRYNQQCAFAHVYFCNHLLINIIDWARHDMKSLKKLGGRKPLIAKR